MAAAETYADDNSTGAALQAAGTALRNALHIHNPIAMHLAHSDSLSCVKGILANWREWYSVRSMDRMASLLRDIAGNLFRPQPVIDSSWLSWNDRIIPKLAQAIYDDRAFDRLPILADALEEAGCTNADILNHCRQPGEHVRGCWVVDLLLGKS